MKKIVAITALALAGAATTATAMDTNNTAAAAAIRGYAPTADVTQLSDQEVLSILNVISGGGSQGEIRQFVRALTAEVR